MAMTSPKIISLESRLKIAVRGAVQGVGFRPFVFRLAEELKLAGWVNNSPQGVFIEAEGSRSTLEKFLFRLEAENPALPLSIHELHPLRSALQHHRVAALRSREHNDETIRDVFRMPDRI